MQALVKYAQECDASFRAPAAEFQHAELQNTPEMRERRFKSGVDALEPSVEKMKHGFTIFSMLDSRADAESEEGAGMRKDLLKDLRKFGEFGGVLAANCGSHCLRSHVRADLVAKFALFVRVWFRGRVTAFTPLDAGFSRLPRRVRSCARYVCPSNSGPQRQGNIDDFPRSGVVGAR